MKKVGLEGDESKFFVQGAPWETEVWQINGTPLFQGKKNDWQ